MCDHLVTPPIDDREGMEKGGEGTSAKEAKGVSDCPRRLLQLMEGWQLVCHCVLWHVLSKNKGTCAHA